MSDFNAEFDKDNYFAVGIKIEHPTLDTAALTKLLELEPVAAWNVGDVRRARNGTELPGFRKKSFWSYSRTYKGRRDFFEAAMELSEVVLESRPDFVRQIIDEGGDVWVEIQLPGKINLGDVIQAQSLMDFAKLGIDIGLETFPGWIEPE